MLNPWRSEFSLILLALLTGVFLGKLFHHPVFALWVALLAYLGHHLVHINRLVHWLRGGKATDLPHGTGIWEEIYYLIFRLRRRNRRRKKQLIRLLDRFRTATAALPDATVVLSAGDQIDWFNDAAGKLLGLRRSDIGQKIGNLLRYPKFAHYLQHANYETTVGIPSPVQETIQLDIRIIPYGDDLRLLVAQDVTQLRFMERVRTDFVANVSHELRTPLTVIRGYVESLVDNADKLPENYGRALLRMEEQTLRMQSLIDDLLTLTRLESATHPLAQRRIDVPSLLREIYEEALDISLESKPAIQLSIETNAGLLGEHQELRSAFTNLVHNALKYCGNKDKVLVRWHDDDEGARLDVSDTGPGIAPQYLPRLTERFYQVDPGRSSGGTGLGLSIVKHVLARHGAEFKISSALGKGSMFSCCFPGHRTYRQQPLMDDSVRDKS
ncbi:MAG: phosphate regulon sensor histidine kinase PhoR [Methylococcaceae bacterium]|nr:phosphate regulon sensor histidine kinase PhoR [Methylococcaceae bacterium]